MWPSEVLSFVETFARAEQILPGGISRRLTWVDPYSIYEKCRICAYIQDVYDLWCLGLLNNFASLANGYHAYPATSTAVGEVVTNETFFALSWS
jgi:hypothetical protein